MCDPGDMQAAQFLVRAVEDASCDWRDDGGLIVLGWPGEGERPQLQIARPARKLRCELRGRKHEKGQRDL